MDFDGFSMEFHWISKFSRAFLKPLKATSLAEARDQFDDWDLMEAETAAWQERFNECLDGGNLRGLPRGLRLRQAAKSDVEAPERPPQLVPARRWELILLALLCVVTAACCLHVLWRRRGCRGRVGVAPGISCGALRTGARAVNSVSPGGGRPVALRSQAVHLRTSGAGASINCTTATWTMRPRE